MFIFIFTSIGTIYADNGEYVGNNTAEITQNNQKVVYQTVCVEKTQLINKGDQLKTSNQIKVKNGTLETVVDNWKPNMTSDEYKFMQDKVWNITEKPGTYVTYPDKYTITKQVFGDKTVDKVYKDGKDWEVTKWTDCNYTFLFRMTEDKHKQDLLLYCVSGICKDYEVWKQICKEKIPCIVCNNTTNYYNITTIINNYYYNYYNNTTNYYNNTTNNYYNNNTTNIINNNYNKTIIYNKVIIIYETIDSTTDSIIKNNEVNAADLSKQETGIPFLSLLLGIFGVSIIFRKR